LLNIPYGRYPFLKTEAEAVAAAKKARGKRIADVLKDVAEIKEKNAAIFIMGDFNEPSHQDWTERAAKSKRHPIKVAYPATLALTKAGFADSYRTIYPDEMKFPGYTWTPRTKITDSNDHHDRIDFIFFRGENVKLKSVKIIGPDKQGSDIVIKKYPSDHRAVLSVFELQ
jgi:exonuclease III